MISRHTMTRDDLVLLTVSAVCIGVASLSTSLVADVVAGVPLIAYLPGAALVSALDRRRLQVRSIERQAWIVGASLGLDVLGGLVLNLTGGLTRTSWLIWIAAVIFGCMALNLALRLMPRMSNETAADTLTIPEGTAVTAAEAPGGSERQRVTVRQCLILVVAAAICVAALVLSVHTDAISSREEFVQAWVLPRPAVDVASPSVEVGIQNRMGGEQTFIVRVVVGSGQAVAFTVTLQNGESWTHVVSRHPGELVESMVSPGAHPTLVTNRVFLAAPDA